MKQFNGEMISWSVSGDPMKWDPSEYFELTPDDRLYHWDGDEWVVAGDGAVGSIARWADDGGLQP
jgi:hypothetical protein